VSTLPAAAAGSNDQMSADTAADVQILITGGTLDVQIGAQQLIKTLYQHFCLLIALHVDSGINI